MWDGKFSFFDNIQLEPFCIFILIKLEDLTVIYALYACLVWQKIPNMLIKHKLYEIMILGSFDP